MVSVDPVVESARGISPISGGNTRNLGSRYAIESSLDTVARPDLPQQNHAAPANAETTTIPSGSWARFGKRPTDLIGAVLLALVFALPMLFIAVLVKVTSPGPVFFRQTRVGLHGREFTIWKFRSMTASSDSKLVFFEDENGNLTHKVKNDPRVTRVGKLIRKTSLDELPQLLNIIKGDMSMIGPRPELPEIVSSYKPWQHARHSVRPGLTGLWQVSGRSNLPMPTHKTSRFSASKGLGKGKFK